MTVLKAEVSDPVADSHDGKGRHPNPIRTRVAEILDDLAPAGTDSVRWAAFSRILRDGYPTVYAAALAPPGNVGVI